MTVPVFSLLHLDSHFVTDGLAICFWLSQEYYGEMQVEPSYWTGAACCRTFGL